ncbi:MAG TPA: hypothetical protein VJ596_00875, partial [Gemmatimonadaceae bacterium]|nr:hypothetical protein [Gemmatimonadaceae bacterium]
MAPSAIRWRTTLVAVSLLVLGAAMGIAADRTIHSRRSAHERLMAQVHRDPLGSIDRTVQLRPDQRAKVAAILERRQPDINAVWADTHVRLRATVDSAVREIAAVLDPDQAAR